MTPVQVWRLFAYKHNDPDGRDDETRKITDWQVNDVVAWARYRGYDSILLTRLDETDEYVKQSSSGRVRHSGGVSEAATQ